MNEISSRLLPLGTFESPRKIRHWGTATLLSVENYYFAVTAAHVLEGFDDGQRLVLPPNISSEKGPRSIFRTEPKDGIDLVDLGVFRFFESEVNNLKKMGFKFHSSDDIILNLQWENSLSYLFSGYPATGVKVSGSVDALSMTADTFAISPSDVQKLGFDPNLHLLGTFDSKKMMDANGIRINPKKPNGMSGGSVLVKQDNMPGQQSYKLVGIGIEHHKDIKILVGIKFHQVAKLLVHGFPETHRFLHQLEQ